MNGGPAYQFNKINEIKIEEILGNYLINIEPGSFCVFDANTPSNGLHYHNFYELCLVTGGSGEFLHGGRIYKVYEGDIFLAEPKTDHEIRIHPAGNPLQDHLYLVFFRINIHENSNMPPKLYEEKMLKEFLLKHHIISRSQKQLFTYLHFIGSYAEPDSQIKYGLYQAVKNMALESIFSLADIHETQFQKPVRSVTAVERAVSFIESNLHRRIHTGEIAASAYTSERNLQQLFKKHMKKTITEYINQRRTSIAAGYLKMNFKVSDISNLFGIADVAQFSRLFKKYYGVPPKKYQTDYSMQNPGDRILPPAEEEP